jgi:hypothetical protein
MRPQRRGPTGASALLRRLSRARKSSIVVGQVFEIIGSKYGWLLIRNAEPDVDSDGKPTGGGFTGPSGVSSGLGGRKGD